MKWARIRKDFLWCSKIVKVQNGLNFLCWLFGKLHSSKFMTLKLVCCQIWPHELFTYCGLVKPCGHIDGGQHWVMACCLTAPSHYLNQCWFYLQMCPVVFTWEKFHKCSLTCRDYTFKIIATSSWCQWVNVWLKVSRQNSRCDFLQHFHFKILLSFQYSFCL